MAEIKGGCRCGKITYVSSADPVFVGVCHCRACQKSTGTAYATVVALPTASLTVSGTTKRYDDAGDTGNATHRDFCPECGSTVTQSADVMDGITMITAGTLDDPSWVKPAMQIYCDSAMPWATIVGMQSFPKMPG
ncbi:MAG: GFA family protein [Rhodopila sp.]|nr:GFA family protein [Rhodopila sp.]